MFAGAGAVDRHDRFERPARVNSRADIGEPERRVELGRLNEPLAVAFSTAIANPADRPVLSIGTGTGPAGIDGRRAQVSQATPSSSRSSAER